MALSATSARRRLLPAVALPLVASVALPLTACRPVAIPDPTASPSVPASVPVTPAPTTTTPAPTTTTGTTTTTATTATTAPTSGAVTGTPGAVTTLTTGFDVPWGIAQLPGGGTLVTERETGRVIRIADGTVVPLTFPGGGTSVPDLLAAGEGGLLGIEVGPAGDVLLYQSTPTDNRVVRFAYDAATAALSDPVVLLAGIPRADTHNGGRIAIGPDGFLYIGTGDAQDTGAAQDPASLAGKILRITLDGAPAPGNPDPASPVWSLGHRNVQGLGWTADGTMIASELGQNTYDELNVITGGANYGWPEVEGPGDGGGEFTAPVVVWAPAEASPSGLAITDDAVYVAALRGERLWRVPLTGDAADPLGEPEAFLVGELGRLRDVEVSPTGALWVLTNNTSRDNPRPGDDRLAEVALVPAATPTPTVTGPTTAPTSGTAPTTAPATPPAPGTTTLATTTLGTTTGR